MSHLFEPLKLRDITLKNRIGIPPMCQYSAQDGMAGDWHVIHYGSRAMGGAGLMILEATGVTPAGRISPGDLGLWKDEQIEPLARIAAQAKGQGCVPAIQLAHAGRKASVGLGWEAQKTLTTSEGGWMPVAPSAVSFGDGYLSPHALTLDEIADLVAAFVAAARRAVVAGFQAIELHAAHGYLLHQFLSPLSNQRTDAYGGSFENRTRLVREVVTAVRAVWPDNLPLLIRLSATDWVDGGWTADETVELCRGLKALGVDLADISTAGLVPTAKIPAGPGFQTGFAARVRHEAGLPAAAVGLITSPAQADHIVRTGQADMVLVGREILRNPYWPLQAAQALGQVGIWPNQYLRAAPGGSLGR
ncbi:NADH:flavin oxidoreductase/NADH oxidase [Dechloromonas sp. HYN0024]|uniref:NADH:flavin oxidoreductase/NADH oxidase n=1 Tax=Dechloromonas sp. HYN0024 TaxID=2231055 RepID=UPI000E434295|nr:NADH:flavin oxidoreductase/NADH oxidase [Dechloromonas sp. HYN0024]AXS78882.1 NADH:flavin oxidoreductase/NADH oxidase [Dechloromonas sp. HYN0024]